MIFYLRVNNNENEIWEKVDEYLFTNRNSCLKGTEPRYSGDYIIKHKNSDKADIYLKEFSIQKLGIVTKLAGELIKNIIDTYNYPGLYKTVIPEFIKVKKRKKIEIHENEASLPPATTNENIVYNKVSNLTTDCREKVEGTP